jgi:hypothetical protein
MKSIFALLVAMIINQNVFASTSSVKTYRAGDTTFGTNCETYRKFTLHKEDGKVFKISALTTLAHRASCERFVLPFEKEYAVELALWDRDCNVYTYHDKSTAADPLLLVMDARKRISSPYCFSKYPRRFYVEETIEGVVFITYSRK